MPPAPPPIPDYALLRCVGRGAYGEVWLARSVTGVYRAVKIVRRSSFEDERPFDREFAGIQRFEPVSAGQDSQVGLLHVGRNDAEGFFYYVMELADDIETGEEIFPERYVPKTLKELRTRQRRLPAAECLSISLALTRALAHLHENGLVHRDIKPSNIVFVHGVPKLADIGLVSAIDTSHSFVGTEGFVPPEGPGTAAADIFSLGKVLYEISTGRDRHDFPNLPEDLMTLPDRRDLLELNEITLRACDNKLARRYPSADAMWQELVLLQAGKSVRRLHLMERRFAFLAKYGIAATIVMALAIGGFVWADWQKTRAEQQRLRAEHAETDAVAQMREAKFNWVRANRRSGQPGQRFDSLAEITRAAQLTNSLDFRNEAIHCLLLPDVRLYKEWAKTPLWDSFNFGRSFRIYGTNDARGNLTIRDVATDRILHELRGDGLPIEAAVSSPDERYVATVDALHRGWMWDLQAVTNQPREFSLTAGATLRCFTPDSRSLLLQYRDSTLHIVDVGTLRKQQLGAEPFKGAEVFFSPSGEYFAGGSRNRVYIHRTADGARVGAFTAKNEVSAMAWHPDGRQLAVAQVDRLEVWDSREGRSLGSFIGHESRIVGLAFDPAGEWLFSSAWDTSLRVWSLENQREVLFAPSGGNNLRMSADGRRLGFVPWDGCTARAYEVADHRVLQNYTVKSLHQPAARGFATTAAFSPNGRLIAVYERRAVQLFPASNPAPPVVLPVPFAEGGFHLEFTPDGRSLFASANDQLFRWTLDWEQDGSLVRVGPPERLAQSLSRGPTVFRLVGDGGKLLIASQVGASWFDVAAQKPLEEFVPEVRSSSIPQPSPDGKVLASVGKGEVQIRNLSNGKSVASLPVRHVISIVFSPDSRWVACMEAGEVTVWKTDSWNLHHRIPREAETSARAACSFDPSSRMLAVTVADRKLQLLDIETKADLATLPIGPLPFDVTFNPRGDELLVVRQPGSFQLWNLRHLRAELSSMGLDWSLPPYPPLPAVAGKPLRVEADPAAVTLPKVVDQTDAP
ncbi:MAG: protein kinase [Verrucomicrobia bacterium]|nr:protein kinase [Verrucomicrobiota bacterium]